MNNEKGFTVVELTLAVALMALLLLPTFSIFLSNQKNVISSNARVDLQDKAQQIMYAFRNECLYTKSIESCTVNGSNANNVSETAGKSFVLIVSQPSEPSSLYKACKYDASTHTFSMYDGYSVSDNSKKILEIDDVVVNLWPIVKDGETVGFSSKAVGIEVEVSLSQEDERLSKKTELVALSNSFYFRNADANVKLISRTPSPKGATIPMPTPIKVTTE